MGWPFGERNGIIKKLRRSGVTAIYIGKRCRYYTIRGIALYSRSWQCRFQGVIRSQRGFSKKLEKTCWQMENGMVLYLSARESSNKWKEPEFRLRRVTNGFEFQVERPEKNLKKCLTNWNESGKIVKCSRESLKQVNRTWKTTQASNDEKFEIEFERARKKLEKGLDKRNQMW